MERIIVAFLLLLAFAAAVEGRIAPTIFDDSTAGRQFGAGRGLIGEDESRAAIFDDATAGIKFGAGRGLIGEDECQRTCKQVHYKAICRSLTKLPKVSTPRELLVASMRVAAAKAKEAKSKVDEYAARLHEGRPMSSILSSCSSGYDDVAQTLAETQKLVAGAAPGALPDVNTQLSAAATSAMDCDNAFADFPAKKSPFLGMQRNVYRLADNVLNIFVAIKQSEHPHAYVH